MFSVNEVTLVGRLGQDPECRSTQHGVAVTSFSIATHYKPSGQQEQTEWHRVVLWDKAAEFARELRKGDAVYVQGSLKTRSYDDKQGFKRYVTEVHSRKFWQIKEGKKASSSDQFASNNVDELPF